MRTLPSTIAIAGLALMGLVLPASAAVIETDFQAGLDGWTFPGADGPTLEAGPDGRLHVRVPDDLPGFLVASAPAKFLGDLRAFDGGTLEFGAGLIRPAVTTNPPFEAFGQITLGSLVLDPVPQGEFHGAAVPMTAAAWGVSQAAWLANLANVSRIEIVLEGWLTTISPTGPEIMRFDFFRIADGFVPEPSAWALMAAGWAAGMAGLARKSCGRSLGATASSNPAGPARPAGVVWGRKAAWKMSTAPPSEWPGDGA